MQKTTLGTIVKIKKLMRTIPEAVVKYYVNGKKYTFTTPLPGYTGLTRKASRTMKYGIGLVTTGSEISVEYDTDDPANGKLAERH